MNKISKLCVAGFCLSLMSLICSVSAVWFSNFDNVTPFLFKVAVVSYFIAAGCCIAGIITSAKGVKTARAKRLKGLPLGISGIAVSALSGILIVLAGFVIGCEMILCYGFKDYKATGNPAPTEMTVLTSETS